LLLASTYFHPESKLVLLGGRTLASVDFLNQTLGLLPVLALTPDASVMKAVNGTELLQIELLRLGYMMEGPDTSAVFGVPENSYAPQSGGVERAVPFKSTVTNGSDCPPLSANVVPVGTLLLYVICS
jgi:hypothetical protein